MASRKKELVRQAKTLGLDHVGTIADLERRIQLAREKRVSLSTVVESDLETEIEDPEELEVPEPVRESKPAPKEPELPRAHPVKDFGDLETRIALRTTVKFIGRWYTLRRGQPITAPGNVIRTLEKAGFVGKK